MRKLLFAVTMGLLIVIGVMMSINGETIGLKAASDSVERVKEIAVVYDQNLAKHFNALTPQERVFIYYLFRASLPGNSIAADQSHRDAIAIKEIFEYLFAHKDDPRLNDIKLFDLHQFLNEVQTYLIYLWTNHGPYFSKEHAQEKRTPARIGLTLLVKDNLVTVLEYLAYPNACARVEAIAPSIFNTKVEPTMTVPNDITCSAVNFYSSEFTNQDFETLPADVQTALNVYFYIDKHNGQRIPKFEKYTVDARYAKELCVAVYWLQKALEHARNYPAQFDEHLIKSLEYLIEYFKKGDEKLFKKHSIEWLRSRSKIDYCFGWIETYNDPMGYRAIFQSDVTIKSLDINKLNEALPAIENNLPFPSEFKRDHLLTGGAALPNASMNVKAFTAGSLGPLNITIAYCLPNYEEIRSMHGSKQIMYHAEKSLGERVNSELYMLLFNSPSYYEWFKKHDPDGQLMRDIFMLEVILHETLGHGSGRLTEHTFVKGEPLTIEGKTYKVGETIPVTSKNIQQFLAGYDLAIEELRAEIIALLATIINYDEFAQLGMLNEWPGKIDKKKMIELAIVDMARTGLRRLISQADDATEISGAHARANSTILNYLVDKGAIAITKDEVLHNGKTYMVLDIKVLYIDRAIAVITELANLVQRIKSTGDGVKAKRLIDAYGKKINQEHMRIMKESNKEVQGELKVAATLFPRYEPICNTKGQIVDIKATWPKNLPEQYMWFREIAYQTD